MVRYCPSACSARSTETDTNLGSPGSEQVPADTTERSWPSAPILRSAEREATVATSTYQETSTRLDTDRSLTRRLLACGIAAGPIYIAVGVLQLLIRPVSTCDTTLSARWRWAISAGS